MPRVGNVNDTDIKAAIELGCRTMASVFNADDNNIPFFASQVRPDAWLRWNDSFSEAHVPGRHLNALLRAEHVLGLPVADDVVARHERAAYFSYSGPLPLPLNRKRIDGPLKRFLPHNLREGFHALYALAAYRGSQRALELAEASIDAIRGLWSARDGWNRDLLERTYGLELVEFSEQAGFITGIARAIGPLAKLYVATGSSKALDLALELRDHALARYFGPDGAYDPPAFGDHVHSTTCTLSSLAQLAAATGDDALLERVARFFYNGLRQLRDELGWSIENFAAQSDPDRGECNNTGDILETALLLGQSGDAAAYHDAERILRGHLLPAQLRDTSFIVDPPEPGDDDGRHDVARRHLGAFGFPAPYGHQPLGCQEVSFNMDIVGGAVASLCEAYHAAVTHDTAGYRVNLLFDHDSEALSVRSPYTYGALRVAMRRTAPLAVRIPPWVRSFEVAGTDAAWEVGRGYVRFAALEAGDHLELRFALPDQQLILKHRTRDIHVRLRGDRVVAMQSRGADLAFYQQFEWPDSL